MRNEKNPDRYRELCTPFESDEAFTSALGEFLDVVAEARVKYKIPDVVVRVSGFVLRNGEEVQLGAGAYFGNSVNELPILAAAYGGARNAWAQLIDKIAGGNLKD